MNPAPIEHKKPKMKDFQLHLRVILTLCLSFTASACLALRDFYVDGLYYNKLSNSTVELGPGWYSTLYRGDITIPSSITYDNHTYTVVAIGYDAFSYSESVRSVKLPHTITEIKDDAFLGLEECSHINIPDKVTKIGNRAFSGCTLLRNVNLPDGLISLGDECFGNCKNISDIILPGGLQHMGEGVFWGCDNLKSIFLPETLDRIPAQSFGYCKALDTIAIPKNVRQIGYEAFAHCQFKALNLPDSLEEIGQRAFMYCDKLKSMTVPKKVKIIDKNTFAYCSELSFIDLPEQLDRICEEAFTDCISLQSQRIPDNVSFIGENAYSGCTGMEEFTFGSGLKETNVCFGMKELSLKKVTSLNPTPPSVESWTTFAFSLFNVPLYVPKGSVESYRAANGWQEFYDIYEIGDTQIEEIHASAPSDAYRMEGRRLIAKKNLSLTVWTLSGKRIISVNLKENESLELPSEVLIIRCDNNIAKINVPISQL